MKFDIVHSARLGNAFADRPGLPEVKASQRIAAAIGVASLLVLFALAFINLALTAPALADTVLPADLAQAAHAYDLAQMKGDGPAPKRLLAEDYTLVNGSGSLEDKAGLVADYTDPAYHIAPFTVREPVVKVWRDGAVLGGLVDLTGVDHGKDFAVTARFADVWAKRNGRWQVIYTEVTHVPAGGKS
jgi:hypothetical protein